MGIGVVPATRKVLEKTGLTMQDFDVIELNEAFAAQVLACDRELKLDHDKLNPNGGAIALGHPIGMTGARIVLTAAYELRERDLSLGLATLCISGGMGMAMVLERV
jgi:acetyl-CoA acetyltransferase